MYELRGRRSLDRRWDAELVRRLRDHLELTQEEFAAELNARQQTVSEWETGRYRPRGPSARLLTVIAEDADFSYAEDRPADYGSDSRREAGEGDVEPLIEAEAEPKPKSKPHPSM